MIIPSSPFPPSGPSASTSALTSQGKDTNKDIRRLKKARGSRISDADIHSFHLSLAKADLESEPQSKPPSQSQSQAQAQQQAILDKDIDPRLLDLTAELSEAIENSQIILQDLVPQISTMSSPSKVAEPASSPGKPRAKPRPRPRQKPKSQSQTEPESEPVLIPQRQLTEADVHLFHLLHPSSSIPRPSSSTSPSRGKRRRSESAHPTRSRSINNIERPIFSHPREVLQYLSPESSHRGVDEAPAGRRRIKLSEERYAKLPSSAVAREKKRNKGSKRKIGRKEQEERKSSSIFWDEMDGDTSITLTDIGELNDLHMDGDGEDEEEVEDGPLFPSPERQPSAQPTHLTPRGKSTRPPSAHLSSQSHGSQLDELLPSSPAVPLSQSPSQQATKSKKEQKKEKKEKKKSKHNYHETEQPVAMPLGHSTNGLAKSQAVVNTPEQPEKIKERHRPSVDGSRKKKKGPNWVTETPKQG